MQFPVSSTSSTYNQTYNSSSSNYPTYENNLIFSGRHDTSFNNYKMSPSFSSAAQSSGSSQNSLINEETGDFTISVQTLPNDRKHVSTSQVSLNYSLASYHIRSVQYWIHWVETKNPESWFAKSLSRAHEEEGRRDDDYNYEDAARNHFAKRERADFCSDHRDTFVGGWELEGYGVGLSVSWDLIPK